LNRELKRTMKIPVFHDDQHGTAIISGAALLNAVEVAGKELDKIRVVFNGAGASAISCAHLYTLLGVKKENIIMCDTAGVIYKGRKEHMNEFKEMFASDTTARTLAEALVDADVFVGLSVGNVVTKEMVKSMAKNPIVFAMANPYPEITYEDATAARADVIMATGRSDYPNQVNNVLGFPFIFRGALDVRATTINDEMKLAASYALAKLAKEEVPESVIRAYGGVELKFGKEYIIPKPFDPRVLTYVAPAVAKAAMETGVARKPISDWDEYRHQLLERLGISKQIVRVAIEKAKGSMKRIVFPEGNQVKILKAAEILVEDKIAKPILLGKEAEIKELIEKHKINSSGFEIVDPENCKYYEKYVEEFYNLRQRKGITRVEAQKYMKMPNYFGAMMVKMGDADGMISGLTSHYPDTIRPALQIVKTAPGVKKVSGLYIMLVKNEAFFFADTTVNVNPTAEDLAEIAILAAKAAKRFNIEPKVAMLSFSNFGNAPYPESEKVAKAVEIIRQKEPDLIVDGEMQADTAVYPPILEQDFPFARIKGKANVLVFPNLDSGNIAYKLLWRIGNADAIGPILMGMGKPIHVLQRGCDVNDIVNMAAIAVVEANEMAK